MRLETFRQIVPDVSVVASELLKIFLKKKPENLKIKFIHLAKKSSSTCLSAKILKPAKRKWYKSDHSLGEAIIEMRETENGGDSSDSEADGGEAEDTSTKFLLLVDQLSVDQKHHLSIKDIGIILDRLSSKILDVEKLDREKEDSDVYNWTIKATIRGEVMRELGVIYNSNYYSISEHPEYLSVIDPADSPQANDPKQ